ncbi:YgiW/YdeI family stress tolerance OB fold protein [Klebsiella michiganensis]|jgi:uncharacterized protein (TIGR00156 family)|uniref:YgiW/YdeI family stress tolerance OB fold protein n=1 Tax=Klebsiella michiganensis TaxID=1134687 RepID=UPI0025708452|nr:NirD/YgiW/YdeI family stress tolerance protein [Klebsiella michiganensis]MDL4454774.1 YgiW/YdeI family stress tolerance OB fold protein [Klebsiella michiganensis]
MTHTKAGLLALLLMGSSAMALAQGGFAAPAATGGFQGGALPPLSVQQALSQPDDSYVQLEGQITRRLGHERYEFRDASGTVVLDIDDKVWHGVTVSPSDRVRIEGEIDKEWRTTEIDVRRVQVVK